MTDKSATTFGNGDGAVAANAQDKAVQKARALVAAAAARAGASVNLGLLRTSRIELAVVLGIDPGSRSVLWGFWTRLPVQWVAP